MQSKKIKAKKNFSLVINPKLSNLKKNKNIGILNHMKKESSKVWHYENRNIRGQLLQVNSKQIIRQIIDTFKNTHTDGEMFLLHRWRINQRKSLTNMPHGWCCCYWMCKTNTQQHHLSGIFVSDLFQLLRVSTICVSIFKYDSSFLLLIFSCYHCVSLFLNVSAILEVTYYTC